MIVRALEIQCSTLAARFPGGELFYPQMLHQGVVY